MDIINMEMWQTICGTDIQGLVTVLRTIRDNLTFDSPGLFPNVILEKEEDCRQIETCNYWLIHHFLYILNSQHDQSSEHLELQKNILAAANLKQPWLFYKIINNYIIMLNLLRKPDTSLPVVILNFTAGEFDIKTISADAKYPEIRISNPRDRDSLIRFSVKILCHFTSDLFIVESPLLDKAIITILGTLQVADFQTKIECLDVCYRYFKCIEHYNQPSLQILIVVLNFLKAVYNRSSDHDEIPHEDLIDLDKAMAKIFHVLERIEIVETLDCSEFLEVFWEFFDSSYSRVHPSNLVQLHLYESSFWICIKTLLREAFQLNTNALNNEENLARICCHPNAQSLLVLQSYLERLDTEVKVTDTIFWKNANNTFRKTLTASEFENSIKYITQFLKLVHYIDRKLEAGFRPFRSDLQTIVDQILTLVSKSIRHGLNNISLILSLFQNILTSKDFVSIDDHEQCQVLEVIFYPMEQDLDMKFKPSNLCYRDLYDFLNRESNSATNQISLMILSLLQRDNFGAPMRNKIRLVIETLMVKCSSGSSFYLSDEFFKILPLLLRRKLVYCDDKMNRFLRKVLLGNNKDLEIMAQNLKSLICLSAGKFTENSAGNGFICEVCQTRSTHHAREEALYEYFIKFLTVNDRILKSYIPSMLPVVRNHFPEKLSRDLEKIFSLILGEEPEIILKLADKMPCLIEFIFKNHSKTRSDRIVEELIDNLTSAVKKSLENSTNKRHLQLALLFLIKKIAVCPEVEMDLFLRFFKMIILFLVLFECKVLNEARLTCDEICGHRKITPRTMFNWYKQSILKLVVMLAVINFLEQDIPIGDSLANVAKLFKYYSGSFVFEHYELIISMLLPYVVKHYQTEPILIDVCEIIQKDLKTALTNPFLIVYLFLNEPEDVHSKCADFIKSITGLSFYQLLNSSDIKKTVAEFLMNYHKNPQCVTTVYRCLLSENGNTEDRINDCSLTNIVDHISSRFLGVLAHFEFHIINNDNEKSQKKDALLSLGELIRFMGSANITPFRFRIVSLLRTAMCMKEPDLMPICAKVWEIFIRNVDLQCLGNALSTIVVSMEPLLKEYPNEVNSILKYLIISNGSLLSSYLDELFFIESLDISDEIKVFISQHKKNQNRDSQNFEKLFEMYAKQINHDNLAVRIYGIKYLAELFSKNRSKLNRLIMGQPIIDCEIEGTLNLLMLGCKNIDENLQLASSICLGELGAIEPTYLRQNYAPQKKFSLTILSDDFAILALAELCQAYQFQKDTKYVDCFSLAIQQILQSWGVDPKANKKMEIWKAIPERMRQLMEPLLTSFYTNINVKNYLHIHPVFGQVQCRSCEQWAYIWATNIIESIDNPNIRPLLISFEPSVKTDSQIMTLMMPYIVLHGLQYSSDDYRTRIKEEFDLVFNTAASNLEEPTELDFTRKKAISCTFVQISDETNEENPVDLKIKCAKLAFNLLDFLYNWCRQWKLISTETNTNEFQTVHEFVKSFDMKLLAVANFNCGEYARSLQHIEQYIADNPNSLQQELSFLGKIYAELQDSDSLEGSMTLKTTNLELNEQVLLNNVTRKLNESTACFERMVQENEVNESIMKDMVSCYLNLDQPETALLICDGLWDKMYENVAKTIPNEIRAEPLLRLGRFEELDSLITNFHLEDSSDWGVRCGQTLLAFRKSENKDEFPKQLEKARKSVLKTLRIAGVGENSYQKGYSNVFKLHLLTEIEKTFTVSQSIPSDDTMNSLKVILGHFSELEKRLEMFKNTKHLEQILCLRRILYGELKGILTTQCKPKSTAVKLTEAIDVEIGKSWMYSTRMARKAGLFQQAQAYVLQCEKYEMKELFMEKAKLLWEKGDQTNAFKTLNKEVGNLLQSTADFTDLPSEDRKIFAKAKFLMASFNAQSMNFHTELTIKHFKESILAHKESEKTFVHFAQFLDKIYQAKAETSKQEKFDLLSEIMANYGKSMLYGYNFIYQSMPRILSIWLDYTADVKTGDPKLGGLLTKIAASFSEQLPTFTYFTAFSQLVSRICHPSQEVYSVLKTILIKLILAFPQQSLWMMLSVLKSSYTSRIKRCVMVLNDGRLSSPTMTKLIDDFNTLADNLIQLTNKEIRAGLEKTTVSELVKKLPRIISDHKFSQIIIPCQKFMQPIIPTGQEKDVTFSHSMAYIQGIDESVQILKSLQKPRRITLLANDGVRYNFLLKPKDDLRKDFRLMEFNSVVKHYLCQDPEAKERRLDIRTYGVLPLNEECGIIEWLDHLKTLRTILGDLYRQGQCGMNVRELKSFDTDASVPLTKKRNIFETVLLKRHPPVLDQWFKANFTTSHNWYLARSAYIRTCAVMSVVGYILGLGDRHCENVLLDETNGDVVHVDFNCLFNMGERFQYPEKVPFRLTQNMVYAMGPLQTEGLFIKSCEVTLRILRSHKPTLMSVLRPFVYDPLVSWRKPIQNDGSSERTDSDAMSNVNNIDERLKGFVKVDKKVSNMPLSTEGQVNFIITAATDVNNLAVMYIGWAPFL